MARDTVSFQQADLTSALSAIEAAGLTGRYKIVIDARGVTVMPIEAPGATGDLREAEVPPPTKGLKGTLPRAAVGASCARYLLIPKFCADSGYSEKAVRMKIAVGVWLQGHEYRKAPDGHILIDVEGVEKWVEGRRPPLSRAKTRREPGI